MNSLWINSSSLRELLFHADRDHPVETGGILAGYFAENGAPVVQEVIGPGPKATHERYGFKPDHAWQCRQLDFLYERSAGAAVYLGDWHTHPNGKAKMSWLDQRTLHHIACHPQAKTSSPVMLIGAGNPQEWDWVGYQYRRSRFWGLAAESEECHLKVFET